MVQTASVDVRAVGVEEELLLVDPESGRVQPVSDRALREPPGAAEPKDEQGSGLEQELFLQQLETGTRPHRDIGDLRDDLAQQRRRAAEAAESAGAAVIASGTSPLPHDDQRVTPTDRYQRIVHEYGRIGDEGAVCAVHVHVDVADDDEGVRVLDALRPWLPVLRALTANSPYWRGSDTGYASWRTQVWGRWPTAGPAEPFGDPATYHRCTDALIASGAALDAGMLYYDARLAASYPTVEVRVFDAMAEIDDVVLVAALTRALVTRVAESPESPESAEPVWRSDLLQAAHWKASRHGLSAELLHPVTRESVSARTAVEAVLAHTKTPLEAVGDLDLVIHLLERLMTRGTGAVRQRAVAASHGGDLLAVVADLRERTAGP